MSRMHEALLKADGEQNRRRAPHEPVVLSSPNGRHAPDIAWDCDGPARQEYERIGVLVKTPLQGKAMRAVAVLGCRSGSGATTTATLMASTLASSKNSRVLLVDANLRTPALDLVFAVQNTAGLTDVLADTRPTDACVQKTGQENLFLLTTGSIPSRAAAVFDRAAIERFLQRATEMYDFVVFDSAPVLEFPATCALASHVDGVLLVLRADGTSVDDARRAKSELERVNAYVLGAVLNRQEQYMPPVVQRLLTRS